MSPEDVKNELKATIFGLTLSIFQFYFLFIDVLKIIKKRAAYFTDFWECFDLFPTIGFQIVFYLGATGLMEHWTMKKWFSIICFFMWIKLIYYFKIFKNTSIFINGL